MVEAYRVMLNTLDTMLELFRAIGADSATVGRVDALFGRVRVELFSLVHPEAAEGIAEDREQFEISL